MEDEDIYDLLDVDSTKVCSLSGSDDQLDFDLLKRLSKNSQYFCSECKRSANDSTVLCSPVEL